MHCDSAIDGVATTSMRARRGVELRGGASVGGGKPGGWVAGRGVAAERELNLLALGRRSRRCHTHQLSGEAEFKFLGLPRRALLELVQSEELAAGAAERVGGVLVRDCTRGRAGLTPEGELGRVPLRVA